MERVERCDAKLRVLLSTRSGVAGRCRRTCEGRHEYDASHNHVHGRGCNGSQETLPRLGDEREVSTVGSDHRNHRNERSMGMASVDHEIRTEHSATFAKPHERSRPGKGVSLRTHSLSRSHCDHSQVGVDLWRTLRRVNEESFLSPSRVPLQMQNLDTFEAMSAVTLQFLQINAQCQAGATRTVNSRRRPDGMEIDALSKKNESKGKSKEKTAWTNSRFLRSQ